MRIAERNEATGGSPWRFTKYMNIIFTISKSYNQFFFVQTLASWHFSCRKEYIEKWLEITGPLSKGERESLSSLAGVLKKYGFDKIEKLQAANIVDFFMRYEESNNRVFSEGEVEIFLHDMSVLASKFNKIWNVEAVKLEQIKRLLEESVNEYKPEILNDLRILFSDQIDEKSDLEVILLISADGVMAGGANNGNDVISFECSSANIDDLNIMLSTLWHEAIHAKMGRFIQITALEMNKDQFIGDIFFETSKTDFNYSEELVAFSIFSTMSYFTDKYFPTDISKKLHDSVANKNVSWLLEARYVFIMYLIYLNGQHLKMMLSRKQSILPLDFAKAIIENHETVNSFFLLNNKTPEWFLY